MPLQWPFWKPNECILDSLVLHVTPEGGKGYSSRTIPIPRVMRIIQNVRESKQKEGGAVRSRSFRLNVYGMNFFVGTNLSALFGLRQAVRARSSCLAKLTRKTSTF